MLMSEKMCVRYEPFQESKQRGILMHALALVLSHMLSFLDSVCCLGEHCSLSHSQGMYTFSPPPSQLF